MNLDLLFDNYKLLLDTPEQIKELNQAILKLAVQGMLLPQDPKDEPAGELIKKIKKEKAKLIREGKIKKEKPLPPIKKEEIPYELPKGWEWVKLGEIFQTSNGGTPNRNNMNYWINGTIPWLKSGELNDNTDIESTEEYINNEGLNNSSAKIFKKGTLVIALYGATAGKLGILGIDSTTNQAVCGIEQLPQFNTKMLFYILMSQRAKIISDCMGGAQPNISQTYINKKVIPLPPINEQIRIVQKIDELINRTIEIENKIKEREKQIVSLNFSALHHLLNSKSSEEFLERFQFIIDNFELLYSDERNVKELKLAILQLAVQGKLVPQNPENEPASKLIKRIKEEKAKLIREGKIKKENPLPPIKEEEIPYELPKGWEWVRLELLTKQITDGKHGDCRNENNSGYYFLSAKDIKEEELDYSNARQINKEDFLEVHRRTNLEPGDVLITNAGTIGRTTIAGNNAKVYRTTFQKSVAIIKPAHKDILSEYIAMYLKSSLRFLEKTSSGSAVKNLLLRDLKSLPFALPPFLEQKCILEKYDQLMKKCDELEAKLSQARNVNENLFRAILNGALNNNSHGEDTEEPRSVSM